MRGDRGKNHDPAAITPDLAAASRRARLRQDRRAPLRGGPTARLDPISARRADRSWAGTKSGASSRTKSIFWLAIGAAIKERKNAAQPNRKTSVVKHERSCLPTPNSEEAFILFWRIAVSARPMRSAMSWCAQIPPVWSACATSPRCATTACRNGSALWRTASARPSRIRNFDPLKPPSDKPQSYYDRIKQRFPEERDLRLAYRPDGRAQYTTDLAAAVANHAADPFGEKIIEREPSTDSVKNPTRARIAAAWGKHRRKTAIERKRREFLWSALMLAVRATWPLTTCTRALAPLENLKSGPGQWVVAK
jgi:hypothetical protein